MGRRGPYPKSPKLKLLEAGRDHRPERMPAPAPRGLPSCPPWLDGQAKREFLRLRRELAKAGLVSTLDRDILAAYCQALARAVALEEALRGIEPVYETPTGYIRARPELDEARAWWMTVRNLGVELGLSPAARVRFGYRKEEPQADWPELTD
jgi:P27 family predicted phage terminase small subunit